MYLNYICHNCGTQNNWYVHSENITEFYCKQCHEHIACSNCVKLKIIDIKKFNYSAYSMSLRPESNKPINRYVFNNGATTTHWHAAGCTNTCTWY